MKRLILFMIPSLLCAQSYEEIISHVDHSLSVKSAEQIEQSAMEAYKAAEGHQLPSLDANLQAIKLEEKPMVTFGSNKVQMGRRNQVKGDLTLTYPLFTGFAISSTVEKAKLAYEKAQLQTDDFKRNLYINATKLYSAAAASDTIIAAREEAKNAISVAYKKAQGLYQNGILAPSELYAIEAKSYEIDAELTEARASKQQILNNLSYLCETAITEAKLPSSDFLIPEKEKLSETALSSREDLLAVAKMLGIAQSEVTMAQSRLYPTIGLVGALKRQGDTFKLNGDGYYNANQNYAGVVASWNLFSGMSDLHTIESAQAAKLAAAANLEDYRNRIHTEIENAYLDLEALQSKLASASMQVKSAQEYARLTQGRFENQLCGADELSRSIADLAAAKAKAANIQSEVFDQAATLWLRGGLGIYREKVLGSTH